MRWQYFVHLLLNKAGTMCIHFSYQEHIHLKTSLEWDPSLLLTGFLFKGTEHLSAFSYLFAHDF